MAVRRNRMGLPGLLTILALFSALPGEAQNIPALERQLTKRVDEYYKLLVTGQWRKVQDYLTEDSQDAWFALPKNTIDSYEIKEVKIAPDRKQADVTALVTFRIPQFPSPFTQPRPSKWVYQKRQWFVRVAKPEEMGEILQKVFGAKGPSSAPQPAQSPLRFDPNPVRLPRSESGSAITVKVPFQNITATPVTIKDLGTNCACLKAEMDKETLAPEEKGILTVTYLAAPAEPPSHRMAVQAMIYPSLFLLDLTVDFGNP